MKYFGIVRVFIYSVLIVGLFCSANDLARLKDRVKHLEIRLNFQVSIRDEEYAEITERLDYIYKVLDGNFAIGQPVISETREISNVDNRIVDLMKEDYARIRKAFREEKTETERIRREIPKIENNLLSINEDMENYCKSALNNTKDNVMAHKEERLILKNMAANVLLNSENDRKMSKQIENLETIVANQFLRIESLLLYGNSCLYLKIIGKIVSGVYKLGHRFEVYCDLVTDGGGWTVFQRRINGEVDFFRNWNEYKQGFGELSGEFWFGNDNLSLLTADGYHELRVEMEDFDGNTAYAKYSKFKIYPAEDKYKLEASGCSGTAGDALEYHNGMMFSTFDSDNDIASTNCADEYHGAWWYKNCHYSNFNGQYYNKPGKADYTGINWYTWKSSGYCLKKVEMKFR